MYSVQNRLLCALLVLLMPLLLFVGDAVTIALVCIYYIYMPSFCPSFTIYLFQSCFCFVLFSPVVAVVVTANAVFFNKAPICTTFAVAVSVI